jgi:uroporphyrinogen III methyltransferase/synthase
VDSVVAYRTLPSELGAAELRQLVEAGAIDILTFTSPSAVESFVDRLGDAAVPATAGKLIGAIGPVTAAALRRVGLSADVVAERAGVPELVEALAARVEANAGDSG